MIRWTPQVAVDYMSGFQLGINEGIVVPYVSSQTAHLVENWCLHLGVPKIHQGQLDQERRADFAWTAQSFLRTIAQRKISDDSTRFGPWRISGPAIFPVTSHRAFQKSNPGKVPSTPSHLQDGCDYISVDLINTDNSNLINRVTMMFGQSRTSIYIEKTQTMSVEVAMPLDERDSWHSHYKFSIDVNALQLGLAKFWGIEARLPEHDGLLSAIAMQLNGKPTVQRKYGVSVLTYNKESFIQIDPSRNPLTVTFSIRTGQEGLSEQEQQYWNAARAIKQKTLAL